MAINLSSLAAGTTKITAITNLIMVSPQSVVGYQPQNPPSSNSIIPTQLQQPPSILFHYEGEQTVGIESDITDHFVENNTAIQDQIALKPVIITTHGFIGELNDVAPYGLKTIKAAADKLTAVGPFAPQLSVTAQIAYSEAFFAYQIAANAVNSAISAVSSIGNLITGSNGQTVIGANGQIKIASNQNKQQVMFQQFYGYWQSRTLFTVQTPWAVFENMAIKSLRAIQDAESRVITDFEVSFKQIRVASTAFGGGSAALAGRAATQASGVVNQGTSSGTPSTSVAEGTAQTAGP